MSSIKKIAQLAGVSVATVSRALRHPEKLSSQTLAKVKKALEQVGYQPKSHNKKYKNTLSQTIAVILPNIKDSYSPETLQGIVDCANQHHYQVMMVHLPPNETSVSFEHLVLYNQCDGLILLCNQLPPGLNESDENLPPLVMACEYSSQLNIPTVHVDNLSAAFEVVSYLIKMGHRKIAEVGCIHPKMLFELRHQGYELALKRHSLKIDNTYSTCEHANFDGGAKAFRDLLALENPPTAIFYHYDKMAIGAIQEAKKLNMNVPKDISIIGFADIPFAQYCEPALTTISLPNYDIGVESVITLLNLIGGKKQATRSHLLDTDLVIRDSVAVPKITYQINQLKKSK